MTRSVNRRVTALGLIGGGVAAGVIGAFALGANAQGVDTVAAPSSTSSSAPSAPTGAAPGRPGGNPNETAVTGSKATALRAAALKQVPGATVDRISTEDPADKTGAAYEVHISTSNGSRATLLFGADLGYLKTETGGGHGGPGGPGEPAGRGGPGRGAGEKVVTGANAATLKAAASKQVPGATVDAVTVDSGDAAYEVHVTRSDGSRATVKFDKNLKFVSVENGMGR